VTAARADLSRVKVAGEPLVIAFKAGDDEMIGINFPFLNPIIK